MLILAFILASAALILQGTLLPPIAFLAFSPFLALNTMHNNFHRALFLSLLAGIVSDLFSSYPPGINPLVNILVTVASFRIRSHFHSDQPLHVSILTGIISCFSTLLLAFLLFLFDRRLPLQGKWLFGEAFCMPLIDATYAFVWFYAPMTLAKSMKYNWKIFWIKRKNRSLT